MEKDEVEKLRGAVLALCDIIDNMAENIRLDVNGQQAAHVFPTAMQACRDRARALRASLTAK